MGKILSGATEYTIGASWADGEYLKLDTGEIVSAAVSGTGGGATPDYIPPQMIWASNDDITFPAGAYYQAAHRVRGQYQDTTGMATAWTVSSAATVDIDAEYSAGSTSGILGGKVSDSWYSVFLLGDDPTTDILLLPFVRVQAISYSDPSTTINPGDHVTGATATNTFITADDQYNTYRLVKQNFASNIGQVFTIADIGNGTPDTVVIAGDVTASILVGDWLQMIPPASTSFLYLGRVSFPTTGNLIVLNQADQRLGSPYPTLTAVNIGAESVVNISDGTIKIVQYGVNSSGTRIHAWVGSVPAAPYTFTTKLAIKHLRNTNYTALGIGLTDGVSNPKCVMFGVANASTWPLLDVSKWNNVTTWTAGYTSLNITDNIVNNEIWLRIIDNNTNRLCDYSYDGINWLNLHTVSRTDFITPTHIGIMTWESNAVATTLFRGIYEIPVWTLG